VDRWGLIDVPAVMQFEKALADNTDATVEEALEQYGKGARAFVARSGGRDIVPPIWTLSPSLLGRLF
jgi:hypothetical protein